MFRICFYAVIFYMRSTDIYKILKNPILWSISLQNTTIGQVDFSVSNWVNWKGVILQNKPVNACVPRWKGAMRYLQDNLKTWDSLNCSCTSGWNLMGRNSTLRVFLPMRTHCQVRNEFKSVLHRPHYTRNQHTALCRWYRHWFWFRKPHVS